MKDLISYCQQCSIIAPYKLTSKMKCFVGFYNQHKSTLLLCSSFACCKLVIICNCFLREVDDLLVLSVQLKLHISFRLSSKAIIASIKNNSLMHCLFTTRKDINREKSTSGSRIYIGLAASQAWENQIILIFSGTSKNP